MVTTNQPELNQLQSDELSRDPHDRLLQDLLAIFRQAPDGIATNRTVAVLLGPHVSYLTYFRAIGELVRQGKIQTLGLWRWQIVTSKENQQQQHR
jgi:hypothetical protein